MRLQTPDSIMLDDGTVLRWQDSDATPIFVLPNNKIIRCKNGTRHSDYIESHFTDKRKQRAFINSVILQGRYWNNANVFSF